MINQSPLKRRVVIGFDELSGFEFGSSQATEILVNNEQPLMRLLVCRDKMCGDREECGVY